MAHVGAGQATRAGEIRKMVAMDGHRGPRNGVGLSFSPGSLSARRRGAPTIPCYSQPGGVDDGQPKAARRHGFTQRIKPRIYGAWTMKRQFWSVSEGRGIIQASGIGHQS
jgi:hypothetical protein